MNRAAFPRVFQMPQSGYLGKWEAASVESSVFDESGNAIIGYRDLVSELRNVERENFTLKFFSGSKIRKK